MDTLIVNANILLMDARITERTSAAGASPYSLIKTAMANGIKPYMYLKAVFTDLPNASSVEDIEALLPIVGPTTNRRSRSSS